MKEAIIGIGLALLLIGGMVAIAIILAVKTNEGTHPEAKDVQVYPGSIIILEEEYSFGSINSIQRKHCRIYIHGTHTFRTIILPTQKFEEFYIHYSIWLGNADEKE